MREDFTKKITACITIFLVVMFAAIGVYAYTQLKEENKDYDEEAVAHDAMMIYRPSEEETQANNSSTFRSRISHTKTPQEVPEETNAANASKDNPTVVQLTEDYADAVGWLSVPGTNIEYAFVQGQDNYYYLRRGIDKKYLYAGTIYIDASANRDFTSFNTVFYGHNMQNSSMFGDLANFQNKSYFDSHDTIIIYLPEETIQAKIIACVTATPEAVSYLYSTNQSPDFLSKVKSGSLHYRTVEYEDPSYLTLSTCGYDYQNERIIIIAIYERNKM